MDDREIQILEREFKDKAENYKFFISYKEKFEDSFFKIKNLSLALSGVILTIVFSRRNDFSEFFLASFIIIIVISFYLLTVESFLKFISITKELKNFHRTTVLAKIRHIAGIRSGLMDYGKRAEQLLISGDMVEEKMLNKYSLDEIIKFPVDKISWIFFILWLLILLTIPSLFLLELFGRL